MSANVPEECQAFFEFWRSLRKDSEWAPSSATFLDSLDPKFAPHIYIIEEEDGQDPVIRFMGTTIVERWGQEKTGRPVYENQPDDVHRALTQNHRTAAEQPCGLSMSGGFVSSTGRNMSGRSVTLPLAVEPGRPKRRVTFTVLIDNLGHDEVSRNYFAVSNTKWVDIGAGVPDQKPLSTETNH